VTAPEWAAAAEELASSARSPAPITWPAGFSAAACLTFDIDAESAVLSTDLSSVSRMSPMSHQSYGPLVGVPRIRAPTPASGLTAAGRSYGPCVNGPAIAGLAVHGRPYCSIAVSFAPPGFCLVGSA